MALFNAFLPYVHPRRRYVLLRVLAVVTFLCFIALWFRVNSDPSSASKVEELSMRITAELRDGKTEHLSLNEVAHPPPPPTSKYLPSNEDLIERMRAEKLFSRDERKIVPGLGEYGKPVHLSGQEKLRADEVFKKEAFNLVLSDKIAFNRSVPDTRDPLCKIVKYDEDLPSATVVIIFTDEAMSTLLRTVWSVLNRSPRHALKEIILVDDASERDELDEKLQLYLKYRFPPLVKLIRLRERQGLIKARLEGARQAKGDVLIFLDSHCETNVMWMEPLLQRIKEERRAVVVPIIEVIDDKTLEYYSGNGKYFQVGGFTWSGHFNWIDITPEEEKRRGNPIGPTRSPTMAGGLFAINRNYFWEVGSYDEGMEVWGGENLEMSFRVWMCGGLLEAVPCSRVGHIFRTFHPYTFPGNKDTHGINTARLVEVWMDDYKRLFYMHRPELQQVDVGDLTERMELRNGLKCKSFKWYLDNIFPQKFILDEHAVAYGRVRNLVYSLCLDTLEREDVFDRDYNLGLFECFTSPLRNEFMSLSREGELRRESLCAEVATFFAKTEEVVRMTKCVSGKASQKWIHTQDLGFPDSSIWCERDSDKVLVRSESSLHQILDPQTRWKRVTKASTNKKRKVTFLLPDSDSDSESKGKTKNKKSPNRPLFEPPPPDSDIKVRPILKKTEKPVYYEEPYLTSSFLPSYIINSIINSQFGPEIPDSFEDSYSENNSDDSDNLIAETKNKHNTNTDQPIPNKSGARRPSIEDILEGRIDGWLVSNKENVPKKSVALYSLEEEKPTKQSGVDESLLSILKVSEINCIDDIYEDSIKTDYFFTKNILTSSSTYLFDAVSNLSPAIVEAEPEFPINLSESTFVKGPIEEVFAIDLTLPISLATSIFTEDHATAVSSSSVVLQNSTRTEDPPIYASEITYIDISLEECTDISVEQGQKIVSSSSDIELNRIVTYLPPIVIQNCEKELEILTSETYYIENCFDECFELPYSLSVQSTTETIVPSECSYATVCPHPTVKDHPGEEQDKPSEQQSRKSKTRRKSSVHFLDISSTEEKENKPQLPHSNTLEKRSEGQPNNLNVLQPKALESNTLTPVYNSISESPSPPTFIQSSDKHILTSVQQLPTEFDSNSVPSKRILKPYKRSTRLPIKVIMSGSSDLNCAGEPELLSPHKRDDIKEKDILIWIYNMIDEPARVDYEFFLKDGCILCKLMNRIKPGCIPEDSITWEGAKSKQKNINNFLTQAEQYGVPKAKLFFPEDLLHLRHIPRVTRTIYALAKIAQDDPDLGSNCPRLGDEPSFVQGPRRESIPGHRDTKEVLSQFTSAVQKQDDTAAAAGGAGGGKKLVRMHSLYT